MRKIIQIVFLIVISVSAANAFPSPAERITRDSMRTKWVDGVKMMLHKVVKGETFYSIARNYKIEPKDLIAANKGVSVLKPGQIIQVPVSENFTEPTKEVEEPVSKVVPNQTPIVDEVLTTPAPAKLATQNVYHVVKKGETLSGISKKYDVPASQIVSLNNLKKNQININQKLLIKKGEKQVADVATTPKTIATKIPEANLTTNEPMGAEQFHTVIKGETLYGISKKYGTTVQDITAWNDIKNNDVKIGQKLIVKKGTVSAHKPETVKAKAADSSTMDAPKTAEVETKVNDVKETSVANDIPKSNPELPEATEINSTVIDKTPSGKNVKQVIENGEGAWVNDADLNPNKYFALHRTAPIGTIMKVTNRMNGKYVFVKVIGKLPGTGDNDKLIIKVSKAAADRLGVLDQTFQCELNFAFASE